MSEANCKFYRRSLLACFENWPSQGAGDQSDDKAKVGSEYEEVMVGKARHMNPVLR